MKIGTVPKPRGSIQKPVGIGRNRGMPKPTGFYRPGGLQERGEPIAGVNRVVGGAFYGRRPIAGYSVAGGRLPYNTPPILLTGYPMLGDDQLGSIFGKVGKAIKGAAKGVAKGVSFAAKNVGKVAPLVAFVPGVGTVAAAAIGAGGKLVSGVARKKKFGQIAVDVAVGGAEGAALGVAKKGVGGLIRNKRAAAAAKQANSLFDVQRKGVRSQLERTSAGTAATQSRFAKSAADAAKKAEQTAVRKAADAARKAADAEAKKLIAQQKQDAQSKREADAAQRDADRARQDAADHAENAQIANAQAASAAQSGGGGGSGAAPVTEASVAGGGLSSLPTWALPAAAVGLFLLTQSKGRRR